MKTKLLGVVAALALFGSVPQASADLFVADFSGTTGANFGTYFLGVAPGCPIPVGQGQSAACTFAAGTHFAATINIDTTSGTMTSSGGVTTIDAIPFNASGSITVDGVGTFTFCCRGSIAWPTDSLFIGDPLSAKVLGIVSQQNLTIDVSHPSRDGFFQSFPQCPGGHAPRCLSTPCHGPVSPHLSSVLAFPAFCSLAAVYSCGGAGSGSKSPDLTSAVAVVISD